MVRASHVEGLFFWLLCNQTTNSEQTNKVLPPERFRLFMKVVMMQEGYKRLLLTSFAGNNLNTNLLVRELFLGHCR